MEGTVKFFRVKEGFGFIVSPEVDELLDLDGKSRDVFVHYTKILMEGYKKLDAGEKVTYDLIWSPEGKPQAENVRRKQD